MSTLERLTAFEPMLCKLADKPFSDPGYIWEPKLDGARIIATVLDGKVRLFGRSGAEKTHLFPDLKIQTACDCVLDGEVVSGDSFNALQHRVNRVNGITQAIKDYPAKYSVFDILQLGSLSIAGFPLSNRKEVLKTIVIETENVNLTPSVTDGVKLFEVMKQNHLEGVVGKDLKGQYHEGKREWLKVKCWQEGMFLAVGYTQGTGWRASTFGALVLADAKVNYVGSVGTGFTNEVIKDLMKLFKSGNNPFAWSAPHPTEPVSWVKPFPVKVKYLEVTADGMLRFPAFKGVVDG
jgi:bifunctional non-homologous end joining protein LigD